MIVHVYVFAHILVTDVDYIYAFGKWMSLQLALCRIDSVLLDLKTVHFAVRFNQIQQKQGVMSVADRRIDDDIAGFDLLLDKAVRQLTREIRGLESLDIAGLWQGLVIKQKIGKTLAVPRDLQASFGAETVKMAILPLRGCLPIIGCLSIVQGRIPAW